MLKFDIEKTVQYWLDMDKSTLLKARNTIPSQLIKEYKPEKVILFGLAAWGEG